MTSHAAVLAAARSTEGLSTSDVVLYLVLPLVLLAIGLTLFLRGRSAYRSATRLRGGFGGPPGSSDIGVDLGLGRETQKATDPRAEVLAAQRQMLWGAILMGVGVIWLVIGLVLQTR